MGLFLDVFKDSAVDCVKMLPFLFLAFYLLEVVEQHASDRMTVMLGRSGGLGPLIGSLLGSVPQCGFSIMASDFFASGVISMGTLLAVYLSTSDEAIIILLTDPEHAKDILFLVLTKIIIGTLGGYIVLFVERRFFKRDPVKARKAAEIIRRRTGSDAAAVKPGFRDLLIPAWNHTKEVFVYLFIFTFLIGFMMEAFGNSVIESMGVSLLSGAIVSVASACLYYAYEWQGIVNSVKAVIPGLYSDLAVIKRLTGVALPNVMKVNLLADLNYRRISGLASQAVELANSAAQVSTVLNAGNTPRALRRVRTTISLECVRNAICTSDRP